MDKKEVEILKYVCGSIMLIADSIPKRKLKTKDNIKARLNDIIYELESISQNDIEKSNR